MTAPKTAPKTAREEWDAIFEYAASRDVESIVDMTEDELDRELAEAGPEAVALAAEGVAEHEAAVRAAKARANGGLPEAKTGSENGRARAKGKARRIGAYGWGAGALAAAAGAAVAVNALSPVVPITGHPREDTPGAPKELRESAAKACEAKQWAECVSRLDAAKALDPEGDKAPEVAALRAAAEAGRGKSGAP
jgi:hypothetical protein